jgi:hypothetical protein
MMTFLAYYTYHGRTLANPVATLNLGCVMHSEHGHHGQGEGRQLIFWGEGQRLDLGELRFMRDSPVATYWRDHVPRQDLIHLLRSATPEGSCGGMKFQLSSAQWAIFQRFVNSAAAEHGN